ncbi:uridine kinase-like protein 2, chloroplastic [Dorcoceras hygrometricum]|uniref:Uridine kinase-like protein 2, chloroplastic n=1 Tax=Dorcoceras hygrometricum TaxID=472368 RepID=A0A2Z7DCE6_9LAMI|nr:uridine kinase-like protein 2, chloroplastic [Dorcoceras hygrometricum]
MHRLIATKENKPVADFLALTKMTSPQLIQTTAYCTSLQELAANRYQPVDASQNVTVLKSLAVTPIPNGATRIGALDKHNATHLLIQVPPAVPPSAVVPAPF